MNATRGNGPVSSSAAIPFPGSRSQPRADGKCRKKILVVDDSMIVLKALSKVLHDAGYEVITSVDGSAAVNAVRREKPHLILLDIMFPPDVAHGGGVAWDGFLILNWLKRMDEAVGVPVMIITGAEPSKFKDRCYEAGVSGFFTKPINHEELLSAIRTKFVELDGPEHASKPSSNLPKVLFVDDENDWRFMATYYLKDAGYHVATARSGPDALAQMELDLPNLVILDVNLAGENGLDVMRLLKQKHPSVPVLLYTGMDYPDSAVKRMIQMGASNFVRKGTMSGLLHAVGQTIAAK